MKITILVLVLAAPLAAQDMMSQEVAIRVDDRGDASAQVQFQLSAQGWIQWKSQYGDHPDLLKRDLTHKFSMYEISDFALTRDDLNRRATASLRIRAQARHKGDGKFEILLPVDWKKVSGSGGDWSFSVTQVLGPNAILNQTVRLVLPGSAEGAALSPAPDGQQALSYGLPLGEGVNPLPLLSGLGLVGLAIVSLLRFKHAA